MSANRDIDDILLNKSRRTKQEQEKVDEIKTACATGCAVVLLAPVLYTLVILLAWNVGIEPFFKTLGNISVWQALGLAFALMILQSLVGAARGNKQ